MKKAKIIIRAPNMKIYSAERRASDLPLFISHAEFIMQGERYLEKTLKGWNATCGEVSQIAPSSGGIVFIDYPSSTILSAQDSTMLEELTFSEIHLFTAQQAAQLAEIYERKRIAGYIDAFNATSHKPLPQWIKTWGDLDKYCRQIYKTTPAGLIRIDIRPWKINYTGVSKYGFARTQAGIQKTLGGYQYSKAEESIWAEFTGTQSHEGGVNVVHEWSWVGSIPMPA